uniref:LNS2/PITP domain-containing protein n=1 Tax=Timema poppense TaxID=170557 RepID=A0A7R9D8Z9_TIMPO|nr:unnamed protein product [Timema poppensis]
MKDKTRPIMFEIDDGCNNSMNDHVQRSWRWGELPSPIILTPESQNLSKSNDLPTHQGFEMEDQPKQDAFKQERKLVNWGENKESEKDMSLLQSPFIKDKESSHCYMQELLKMCMGDVTMSLCGGLNQYSVPSEKSFCQHQVTYEGLNKNPDLLENPDLVVRFCGKYLSWKAAAPQIISVLLFHKHLPQNTIDLLTAAHTPLALPASKEIEPVSESGRSYSSWFSWRRKLDYNTMQERESCNTLHERLNEKPTEVPTLPPTSLPQPVYNQGPSNNIQIITPHGKEGYSASDSSLDSNMGFVQGINVPIGLNNHHFISKQYRKTLRLSSEQIASLNLQDGPNDVTFSVTTAYQGTTRCQCHIYKWHFADKIVISDIDGTITKSDVLGHLFAIVGKDWAQIGVAQLFTKIKNNGYKLLYLSARAIGQAHLTREYLRSIRQNDLTLPDGPLLLSPTSLINAIHREVIEKKPEEFKIPCLKDIKALFPNNINPFYAGYGNKGSDVFAYREVGIPIFRIFTINSRGELKHELTNTFQSSYSGQSCIVNDLFPPLADSDM